jgi:tRNA pseudouridine13 synthase
MCSATTSPWIALRRTDFRDLPHAWGRPAFQGVLRSTPSDFIVTEELPFELSGTGEHLYLRVLKTGQNTRWVAKQLARNLNLKYRAVGYAGLKDRHAVAEQWFSLHLPGRPDPEPDAIAIEGIELIETRRHTAKLRIGALAGNGFQITVRQLQGEWADCERRLERLRLAAVPNYFGAQRFGRDGRNIDLLSATMMEPGRAPGREARSFGLSALRSALFNDYLAGRIEDGCWESPLQGEILYCAETSGFKHFERAPDPQAGLEATGLLWGVGENQATGEALERERAFFGRHPDVTAVLASFEARMSRRSLQLLARDLNWKRDDDALEIRFSLGRGQYATTLLREILNFEEAVPQA